MGSSSTTPPNNPLAFSLSTHHHHHHHHPYLFSPPPPPPSSSSYNYPIATPPPPAVGKDAGGGEGQGTTSGATAATDLSMFKGGPKHEDFLGGSGGGGGAAAAAAAPPLHHHHHQNFSTTTHTVPVTSTTVPDNDIYDSELKTIAASFLRGFSSDHPLSDIIHKQQQQQEPAPKRSAVDTFGQRTSIYRGVTRHRWTGRYEAHLWDNSCRREGQSRKGRQVYLGGYDKEDKAARAYDLAALKYWGPTTTTNFPISNYEKELEEMKNMTRQEFIASLRRKSSGFSRGASIYRGVTRHHQHGRWQARIGRVAGNKDLYLGTYSTQEEAAEAYDIAAIKFRGLNAVTNFDMSRYDVKSIANSNLPIGGLCNKSKNSTDSASDHSKSTDEDRDHSSVSSSGIAFIPQPSSSSTLSFAIPIKQDPSADYWSNIFGYNNNTGGASSNNGYRLSYGRNSTVNESINNGLLISGDGYVEQQQQQQESDVVGSTTNSLPFPTPVALNNNNYESSSSGYGNWNIAQSLRSGTYQTAKPSISVFQTPIFGME